MIRGGDFNNNASNLVPPNRNNNTPAHTLAPAVPRRVAGIGARARDVGRPPGIAQPGRDVEHLTLVVQTEGRDDLQRAIDQPIAADNPAAAERGVQRLVTKAQAAARTPMAGRVVPKKAQEDVREVFLRTSRVVYRVREGGIVMLAVLEGHRLFPRGALKLDGD